MPTDRATTYEHSDARVRPIVLTGVFLVALCVAGLVGAWVVTGLFEKKTMGGFEEASPLFARDVPEEAPLLTDEPAFAKDFVARQKKQLNGYGWVDRSAGVVHIPIERAMERVAEAER